jgi:hypothetical protein
MKEIDSERQKSKEEKAKSFISKSTSFRPGKKISAKVSIVSGLMPKRAVSKELLDNISKPANEPESGGDERIAAPKRVVSSLGRLSFDLIQVSNNLDAVVEVIENDYKNTRTTNKKELEEYKKRVANRGRILGKKDLGDNKVDLMGLVKRYVGGFFSGTGGAIRGLAMFNLLQGLLSGDPSKIIGPLLGIGATYIPAIGMGLGAIIAKSLLGNLFGAGQPNARKVGPPVPGKNVPRGKGFGKFALLAGAGLSLASIFSGSNGEDDQKDRLDDLTEQQKGSVSSDNLVPIPQDDLKRFEALNKKFEKALDFLMGKQKDQDKGTPTGAGNARPAQILPPQGNPTQLNSGQYKDIINQASQVSGIPASQIAAMGKIESAFDPNAKSKSGALGIMQMMPDTFAEQYKKYGNQYNLKNDIKDPQANIILGSLYMKDLLNGQAKGNVEQMVKMYNAGPAGNLSAAEPMEHWTKFKSALKDFANLESGLGGMNSVPSAPLLPTPTPTPTPVQRTRNIPPPASFAANILPIVIPQKDAPQTVASAKGSNNTVPAFSTSYSENFLVMYSKLTYQIV